MSVLERVAEYVAGLDPNSLSADETEALGVHVLDALGAMIAGRATPDGAALARLAAGSDGRPGAFAEGTVDDVAVRAATARLTEIDDIHLPSCTTPGSVVVPVALTVAARIGDIDAARFAAAVAVGYEVLTRLGRAIRGPEILYRGVWPTYFAAPAAAATVTARLLGLSADRTVHALALALVATSGAAGRWGGGWSGRWLVLGQAAHAGCTAALAAADGYTGDAELLDGDWLQRTHGIEHDPDVMTEGLGATSVVASLSIKPYCSAKQAIAAIYGLRGILSQGVAADDIRRVRVGVPPQYRAMISRGITDGDRLSSIVSAPYQLALIAYAPDGLHDVARSHLADDERIQAFMAKVEVADDDGLAAYYPERWPARVEVETAAGRWSELVLDAPGDPGRRFDAEQARAKFGIYAGPALGDEEPDEWIDLADRAIRDDGAANRLAERVDEAWAVPPPGR